jgi:ribosomal protein S18 acetylase RimI-like enzyme
VENIEFKELGLDDINGNLLDNFNRYQKVTKSWYKSNGNWELVKEEYIADWDKIKKDSFIKLFFDTIIEKRGNVFGAYKDKILIGFSVLLNNRFGTKGQYVELKLLHISLDYRNKGLGKKLFGLCVEKAKENGNEKIYISANNAEEAIEFYLKNGCKDAIEINKQCVEEEPTNRELEYVIG